MVPLVCPVCRIALPPVDNVSARESPHVSPQVCPRDGHAGQETSWLDVPDSLRERFTVLEPFARGETGSLYLADEPETGRRGLLKLLDPTPSQQPADRQRLRRELVKQASLERTHLAVPHSSGESDGIAWIFRDWLDGISLEVRLSRDGALAQPEAIAIAAQLASALDTLHRGGLLHRDVKPGHVLLQRSAQGLPRAILLDAGVGTPLYAHGDVLIGTPGYIAPEQLLGNLVSFRSDLYSLGCLLYRMLTGRPAFSGESLEEILSSQRYGELPALPPGLPAGLGALLSSSLAKEPQERPFSAQKLRRTLDPFLPDGTPMDKQPTTTFEKLPESTPSQAPQPSGTLRPPPPPLPGSAARTSGTLRPATPSAPPPVPPVARDATHPIDLDQLEELEAEAEAGPATPRPISVPPALPPQAGVRAKTPPPPRPALVEEKTQPIRLEQILAIEDARRQQPTQAPPARPITERPKAPSSMPPALPPGSASRAAPSVAPPSKSPSTPPLPAGSTSTAERAALREPGERPRSERPTAEQKPRATLLGVSGPLPGMDELPDLPARGGPLPNPKATLPLVGDAARPAGDDTLIDDEDEGADDELAAIPTTQIDSALLGEPTRADVEIAPPTPAMATAKATLLGIGSDPLEPPPAVELGMRTKARTVTSERDFPTERLDPSQLASAAHHAGRGRRTSSERPPADGDASARADTRRTLMYASAALVGLGVLAFGVSSLIGGSEAELSTPVGEHAPAATSTPGAAPSADVSPLAEAPRPATEPAAAVVEPTPAAQPAPSQPAEPAPTTAALATPEPSPSEARGASDTGESTSSRRSREASDDGERATRRDGDERRSSRSSARDEDKEKAKESERAAGFAEQRDLARNHYTAHRYREAASAYERAARYDPSHPGTQAGLGAARLQLGDYQAAIQAYQRAVQLSPTTSGFHAALGRAYLAAGDKNRATAEYKKALSLDANNEAARVALKQLDR